MPLQRIELELDLKAISPLGDLLAKFYRRNSSIELLQTLFLSEDVIAELVRVRRESEFYTLEQIDMRRERLLRKYGLLDFEIIGADRAAGYYTAVIKHRTPPKLVPVLRQLGGSVYLAGPMTISAEKVLTRLFVERGKATCLAEMLEKQGIRFRIRSVSNPSRSPGEENVLTASQLSLVQLARTMGYFDVPRKVSTSDVAKIAGVTAPAVSKAIRRVERVLVEKMLRETNRL